MRCKELSVLTMLGFSLLGLRSIRVLLWRLTEFRSDYEKSLALLSILMVCTAESKAQPPFNTANAQTTRWDRTSSIRLHGRHSVL